MEAAERAVGQRVCAVAAVEENRPASELLAAAFGQASNGGIDAAIPQHFANALTRQVEALAPRLAVEIGMANGISTLAILAGLPEDSRLISIDPFQDSQWHGAGAALVAQSNRSENHELRQEPDFLALPALLREGAEIDFAYIDGMHTFDYVALDAFYIDKLLKIGGVVAFNDCGFRSIRKFLRFFLSHRHYEEVDVGLPCDFRGANPLISLVRQIEGRSNQDRYFRKLDRWEGEHNYYRRF